MDEDKDALGTLDQTIGKIGELKRELKAATDQAKALGSTIGAVGTALNRAAGGLGGGTTRQNMASRLGTFGNPMSQPLGFTGGPASSGGGGMRALPPGPSSTTSAPTSSRGASAPLAITSGATTVPLGGHRAGPIPIPGQAMAPPAKAGPTTPGGTTPPTSPAGFTVFGPGRGGGGGGGGGGDDGGGGGGGMGIAGTVLKIGEFIQNLGTEPEKAIERQRTLFLQSQSISGTNSEIGRLSTQAMNAMGNRFGREGDDMRVLAAMRNVVPSQYTSSIAQVAGFNFLSNGIQVDSTARGYAGLLSGKTSNSLYKMGILTTNPDGSAKDPTILAKELYQKFNIKNANFKSLDELNRSITAGVINSNLNALDLTPESREQVEVAFRNMWQADSMGMEYDTRDGSAYASARGLDDPNQNPQAIEGPANRGATETTEAWRPGQVQAYKNTMKVQETYYDTLANITDKLGPFGDSIIAVTGTITNAWKFIQDKLGMGGAPGAGMGGIGGSTQSATGPGSGLGGGPSSKVASSPTSTSSRGASMSSGITASFTAAAGVQPFSSATPAGSATGSLAASTAGTKTSGAPSSDTPVGSPGSAKDSNPDSVAKYLAGQLATLGLTTEQIAGVLGNIQQESGFNPKAIQDPGPGRGLAQWSVDERWAELKKWAKKNGDLNPWEAETQVAYILKEMKEGWGNFDLKEFKKLKSADAAGKYFGANYEVFGESGSRDSYVQDWERKLKKQKKSYSSGAWEVQGDQTARVHNGEMIIPAQFAAELRKAFDGGGGGGGGGTINVTVMLKNGSQSEAQRLVGYVADEFRRMNKLDSLAGS